jgi:alkanesulfonate monooxygenase SsuD/methylene tetrahydromethanopterin reductase-like flavin-dependent oxidoreductase (luciferase family)
MLSDAEKLRVDRIRSRSIYGTPDVVGAKLRALAEEFQVEEIAILTTVHDPAARRRSYELLAAEFGMHG